MRMPRVKAIEAIEYDDDFDGYDEAYDEPMGDDDGITTEDKGSFFTLHDRFHIS